jgi:hypothetical protein
MAAALAGAAMCDKRKFCDLTDLKCLSITSIVRKLQTLRPRWGRHVVSPLALALLLLPNCGTPFQGRIARKRPQPGRDFRKPQKITTMRLKFGVHPGNVGLNLPPAAYHP